MAIKMTAHIANPPVHSTTWQNVISSNLEEQQVDQFLSQSSLLIEQHTIPSAKHLQILLHLVLYPPRRNYSPATHSALDILYDLLSLHHASSIARQLPRAPRTPEDKEEPRWLRWEARGAIERDAKKTMSRCISDGIWGLIWDTVKVEKKDSKGKGKVKGKKRRFEENEEEEEEEEEQIEEGSTAGRRVSENGWALLGWCIKLWEKDREEQTPGQVLYSPLFLEQLPHYRPELPIDNASAPLAVVRAAFSTLDSPDIVDTSLRRDYAIVILQLLFASALAPGPIFHPHSLVISTLSLIHSLPIMSLDTLFSLLAPTPERILPQRVLSHLYAAAIEDLAGVRVKRQEARRRKNHVENDYETGQGTFPNPTFKYCLDLMVEQSKTRNTEDLGRMVIIKTRLWASLLRRYPLGDPQWTSGIEALGHEWRDKVEQSVHSSDDEQSGKGLLSLIDMVVVVS